MLIMCFVSVFITMIYIFLLKWITKPLLYVSMILILAGFVLLGLWCLFKRNEYDPETQKKNWQYATVGMGVSWTIAVVYFLFMCCCFKNIALGASIMEVASEFIGGNFKIVSLPVITYFLSLIVFCYWMVTTIYVFTIGDVEFKKNQLYPNIVWD